MKKQRIIGLLFALLVGCGLFFGYFLMGESGASPLFDAVFARGAKETYAQNLVAAVYLNYRLFDTLLEALLLLVSVIGVSQFASLADKEKVHPNIASAADTPRHIGASHVMTGSLKTVYLLIAIIGVYTISTGMDGPGGGFQGGAILAAIMISAHFAEGRQLLSFKLGQRLEKVMYVLILLTGIIFFLLSHTWSAYQHRIYLVIINILIGIKVFSGLSMIYLHFMSGQMEDTA